MAIEIGGSTKTKVKPAMNITPLVDVVLVLLIIFMVVTPMMTKQFWVLIPKQDEKKVEQVTKDDSKKPIVLSVLRDGSIKVNSEVVPKTALAEKLKRAFAAKNGDHTLFFSADDEAPFGVSVEAMDLARTGGATPINVLTIKPKG
jgi:biopolymer transport protein ExbD/biopolymer transport protein TolR